MANNTFPLLVKDNNKIYRIANITVGSDNSFYFSFPNSNEYKMTTYNKQYYRKDKYSYYSVQKQPIDFEYKIPKISFHPKSYTMHIKSQSSNQQVGEDYDLYNFDKNGYFECPFMQIYLPYDLSFFDEYNKTKYPHKCIIEKVNHRKVLAIYVLIHSVEIVPPSFLPFQSKTAYRLEATALINGKYTLSLFSSYLPRNKNNDSLTLIINTKNCSILTALEKTNRQKEEHNS